MDASNEDFKEGFYEQLLDSSFLQENTQKLCDYLCEHIPCDRIILHEVDRNLLEVHIIFEYHQNSYVFKPKIKSIPYICPVEDLIAYFEEHQEIKSLKDVRASRFNKQYASMHPEYNSSLEYFFYTDPEYQKVQMFIILAKKANTFTDKHVEIINQLQSSIRQLSTQLLNTYNEHRVNLRSLNMFKGDPEKLLKQCPGLNEVNKQIRSMAKTNSTVLIYGETGVGKELVADLICSLSARFNQAFQKINCGSLTPSLIDSELFGVVKGAFTGAVETKKGIFESAHGGTLYLDEIGELSLDAQVRLLRVLEAKEIRRVGDTKRISIDVRIIAATNRNLEDMVQEGTFRGDLLYRISVLSLYIPPLSERPEDIPILAQYFYSSLVQDLEIINAPKLTEKVLQQLLNKPWPGNVRQLRYTIERSLILGGNKKELEIISDQKTEKSSYNVSVANSEKLLKQCPCFAEINVQIQDIAKTNSTVLIYGESGVGKELVADTICSLSSRSHQVFQKINCGAIPSAFIDSELFGVARNVHTGAVEIEKGAFELANGGTLYIDEIGALSLDAQVRLLRAMETKEIKHSGGTKYIPVDVRIIVATNRDLEHMVQEGTFRGDLLYHISVIPLYIPSLSERPEDIPILAHYFYETLVQQLGIVAPPKLTEETLQQLLDNPWAGNVNQLKYTIERSLILGKNKKELKIINSTRPIMPKIKRNTPVQHMSVKLLEDSNNPEYYEILSALRHSCGCIEGPHGAAKALGLHPATLRYRMKKYKIKRQEKS